MIGFEVLGVPVLRCDGAVQAVSSLKLRHLLVILAARAGRPVSADALIESLWDLQPPVSARSALYVYVSRLRSLLGADGDRIESAAGSYALRLAEDELDASRFRRMVAMAAEAADPTEARRLLRAASRLWRGPAFDGYRSLEIVASAAEQLDQLRLHTFEQWIDLELGEPDGTWILGEIDEMIAEHPYRERLRALRMLALYREGRQAEALQTYRDIYQLLLDELGIDPGPELQAMHRRILSGDPDRSVTTQPITIPSQLPSLTRGFVGRMKELRQLAAFLAETEAASLMPIVCLSGMSGIGKTSLALQWAHRIADRYVDGHLYLDLRGDTGWSQIGPATMVSHALRALGASPDRIPDNVDEAAALYRSMLTTRSVMIVIDNAVSFDQVKPLLPGGTGCVVIVTSRLRLAELEIYHGAYAVRLDGLPADDAELLLSGLIGPEFARSEAEVVADVARLCAYLPLALRIAAARMSEHADAGIAWYRDELASDDRLGALSIGDGRTVAIRVAFDVSYRLVKPTSQRLFRLLSLVPGPDFGPAGVAALADLTVAQAKQGLAELVSVHLVRQPTSDRYAFHDLIREFAQELVAADAERESAVDRLYAWYVSGVQATVGLSPTGDTRMPPLPGATLPTVRPVSIDDPAAATAWLQDEYPNLVAALIAGVAHRNAYATALIVNSLRYHLISRAGMSEWVLVAEAAESAAAEIGYAPAEVSAHLVRATMYGTRNDYARAEHHLSSVITTGRETGWDWAVLSAQANLVVIYGITGRLEAARRTAFDGIEISRRLNLPGRVFPFS